MPHNYDILLPVYHIWLYICVLTSGATCTEHLFVLGSTDYTCTESGRFEPYSASPFRTSALRAASQFCCGLALVLVSPAHSAAVATSDSANNRCCFTINDSFSVKHHGILYTSVGVATNTSYWDDSLTILKG